MTERDPPQSGPRVSPETLELRARPQPVTRINSKVLIGCAAVFLLIMSAIVLMALKPPRLHTAGAKELFNVEHKPISDGLAKLPATYDGVRPVKRSDPVTVVAALEAGVPRLTATSGEQIDEAERMEKARLARMAGQAREAQVFFRLQMKAPPHEAGTASPHPAPPSDPKPSEGDLATLVSLRAAERGRALTAGDLDVTANDPAESLRKLSFLKTAQEKDVYNPHALEKPQSPYQLMAGTVIAASLVSGLNSDLPGFVIAQVTENVYDTVSGRFLLIPQGSRLLGKYDNVVAFGQERALVVWQRILRPDGSSVVIDNLPAADTSGYAGLADEVDLHTWKLLKGVALATVLGVGSQLAFGSSDNDLIKALSQATQSTTNRAGQRLVERNLNVAPTLTVRPGWPLRVIVHKDIVLQPYRPAAFP
ncbi:MAG TPA: TrbI/VirB10 family protein [Hyphomicrobiaceae bacterium]|nr:TrbI/VirB10 family protein [Hyphomicrobiaceae bacterium]